MSRYLLDTGLVIRHLRGRRQTARFLRGLGKMDRLGVAAITRLEVYAGMREGEQYATRKLLSRFLTYEMNGAVADKAGNYIRYGQNENWPLSVPDAIIAATAVQHNLTLVTLNQKDFQKIPGLSIFPFPQNE
ncbi:MAG: type II toxin-antitoxin system VapC family toxin [Chloroflexi bacterium]|nr:type II toxin-antitoxin system VapC family toxin [Chloroflexota bacterium]